MTASELRIGNFILRAPSSDYKNWKETTVNLSYLELVLENPDGFKPIPLTQEWLTKFGFGADNKFLFDIDRPVNINIHQDGYVYTFENKLIEIRHVHQLQNVYFAMTGNELEIK